MSILAGILDRIAEGETVLETYNRQGELVRRVTGFDFCQAVLSQRAAFAGWDQDDRRVALLFRSDETLEFLVATFAALAERLTVVPLYPTWSAGVQRQYLERYRLRTLAAGESFRSRAEEFRDSIDRFIAVGWPRAPLGGHAVGEPLSPAQRSFLRGAEFFPRDLPDCHPCASIFTSGTSGDLAKCTLITQGNLAAAIENIRLLDFLHPGMTFHCPLSASHIFAFVVILGFLALKPRRVVFSDIQYLARLPEERIGRIDAIVLIPLVLKKIRAGFYERLARPHDALPKDGSPPDADLARLVRLPQGVRRGLAKLLGAAERAVIACESGKWFGFAGWPLIQATRRLLGGSVRRRLASPRFVVVGGAKPGLKSMAFLEAMGIRCLQGWGMTETTGPLAVCRLGDRFRGAFGTCGDLFGRARAYLDGEELVVEGPQIASGYLEPDGTLLPFGGRLRTGDHAAFDGRGRLKVLGKVSDRITLLNGLNYNPIGYEEMIHARDLKSEHMIEEVVVLGDGQAHLGCVFFLREPFENGEATRRYLGRLLREVNMGLGADDRIGPWAISPQRLRDADVVGPSAKIIRRRIEERYAHLFEERAVRSVAAPAR